MRLAILLVACSMAVEAQAGMLFTGFVDVVPPVEPLNWRVSYNESAYIEKSPGQTTTFLPGSSANVDAFIAMLQNGVTDDLTLTNSQFTYTVPENTFWAESAPTPPLRRNSSEMELLFDAPDLQYFGIDSLTMQITATNYRFAVFGTTPEPSSGLLMLVGLCGLVFHRKH